MSAPRLVRLLAVAAVLVTPSFGALYTSPSQLPATTFDYIIVGAGTAGNVIASRLTENPALQVLVLEAGIDNNNGDITTVVPFMGPNVTPYTIYDWNYTTTPQSALSGRTIPYPRGKVLGGSSTVNYIVYMRGSSEDFNRYASITGDSGWNWNNMKKYIKRHEKFVTSANTIGKYTASKHGFNGVLPITLPDFPTPLDNRVLATTKQLAAEFPFNADMSGGDVLGVGWMTSSISNGSRASSATSYLARAINRSNLHVLINSQVTKLVQTGTLNKKPLFRSLQFSADSGATFATISARKEIILSAGSIGTPQILLLSGIGAKSDLTQLGIPVVVNNPSVGRNLSDHVLVSNVFNVQGTDSYDTLIRNSTLIGAALNEWLASKTGSLSNNIANHVGYLRLPSNSSIFQTTPDPAAGPASSHWEILFSNLWVNPGFAMPDTGSFMSVPSVLISPTSRGYTKLVSADPFTAPLIDPNFVSTDFDLFALREAVKAVKRFVSAAPWQDYVISPYGSLGTASTDTDIETYVKSVATTIFHPVGTASMSPKNAAWGVVDPDLKVKGVEGVRVADASILPFSPNAHTQGPVYLIAERAADIICA